MNGARVRGWSLDRVTDSLRGKPGTIVQVTFARPGATTAIETTLSREVVRIPAVPFATLLPGHVGYLPLQQFNATSARETRRGLDSLVAAGATSLVLDLRGDGGGIVDQAVDVAGLFLAPGSLVARVRGRGAELERYETGTDPAAPRLPLVVLVDEGTASAAEIIAGALQDHDRALVLGERTFGKGLVQGVWRLDGGWALKMTTGRWVTPSGRSIHRARTASDSAAGERPDTAIRFRSTAGRLLRGGGGIVPDVEIAGDTLDADEKALASALAPHRVAAYKVLADYALELKDQVRRTGDTVLAIPPAWRDELHRRWLAAGVSVDRRLFDAARATVDRMLVNNVGRHAWGDALVLRRVWQDDPQLARAAMLLRDSRTTAELLALGPK